MNRLFFASLFTLSILTSFVAVMIILIFMQKEIIDVWIAIGLTIGINFIIWLIAPAVTDFINKRIYKVRFLTREEVITQYPEIAQLINEITTQYKFPFPKIGIISDKNPTAFTYGSARFNARIILTEGIFEFLNTQEIRAVVAHECAHIVNRDFIVIMIASTFVQILYEIYAKIIKFGKEKNKGLAILALVLYEIGILLLCYLNRTREYLADEFAAKKTDPRDLANALIKIAYGIATTGGSKNSQRLLHSTRHLGIVDVKNAKHIGTVNYMTNQDPNAISEAMVFDKISPWAKLSQLKSTHPLTGNRIDRLNTMSKTHGYEITYNINAAATKLQVNKLKLYRDFSFDMLVLLLPFFLVILSWFLLPIPFLPALFGIGLLLQIPYKFPRSNPQQTTILEQMRNPYASPFKGVPISLSGQVIGRGIPGYVLGEDMMYQDTTGLIYLKYASAFGYLGNVFFALKKVKALFTVPSNITGWFYRGVGSFMFLKCLKTNKEKVSSYPILSAAILPLLFIGISVTYILTH